MNVNCTERGKKGSIVFLRKDPLRITADVAHTDWLREQLCSIKLKFAKCSGPWPGIDNAPYSWQDTYQHDVTNGCPLSGFALTLMYSLSFCLAN